MFSTPGLGGICYRNPPGCLWRLAAESVDGSALSLEGVDYVEGGDGLAAGVLGVRDRVADHGLEEGLEDSTGLLIDEAGDSLDTTSASKSADCRLGDHLC